MKSEEVRNVDSRSRDQLAVIRTVLANERTLLAFIRTALTLLIAGVTFVQVFSSSGLRLLGMIFVFVGTIALVSGVFRYRSVKARLEGYNAG